SRTRFRRVERACERPLRSRPSRFHYRHRQYRSLECAVPRLLRQIVDPRTSFTVILTKHIVISAALWHARALNRDHCPRCQLVKQSISLSSRFVVRQRIAECDRDAAETAVCCCPPGLFKRHNCKSRGAQSGSDRVKERRVSYHDGDRIEPIAQCSGECSSTNRSISLANRH